MSDSPSFAFGKFVPGFDFLQQLAGSAGKSAASPLPGLGGWVAPTVSVEELDKRIQELKAVQFWLDQNAHAVKATIQALEVQKMTLSTLAGMNLSMSEVARAFTLPTAAVGQTAPPPAAAAPAAGWPFGAVPSATEPAPPTPAAAPVEAQPDPADATNSEATEQDTTPTRAKKSSAKAAATSAAPAAAGADPMLWWGALTQQFQQIAVNAMRDAARQVPPDGAKAPAAASEAEGAAPAARTAPARKKAAAKKKPAAKSAARKKTGAAPAKKAAGKTASGKSTGTKRRASGTPTLLGWPLPPPFKLPGQ